MEVKVKRFDDELRHYGIKGMKWGVRRYQNKDGTLTGAGKKRYNETHDYSKSDGPNKKRLSTKQKIAIGAAVAGGVLAAYGAYKISNSRYFDRTIKAGKDFYRTGHANEKNEGLNELIYATIKKRDAKIYSRELNGGVDYVIHNPKNVKIAGTKTGEKIFKELVENNAEFRKHYGNMSYVDFNGGLGFANKMLIEQNKLYGKTLKDMYNAPFFEALESKGYEAIVDTQDKFAKIPVILINSMNDYTIAKYKT